MPIGPPASGVGRENAKTCGELVTTLLRRLGHDQDENDNRALAKDALNQSINEFNLERVWNDRLIETTIALITDTKTYPLPARMVKSIGAYWLRDTSGNRILFVADMPYWQWLKLVPSENVTSSQPQIAFIQNRVDSSVIELWPAPTAANIVNFPTLEVNYYAEIPICTDDNDNTAMSGAIEQAIFANALYILNDFIGDEGKANRFLSQAINLKDKAVAFDNRMRINPSNLRGIRGSGA